jgi:hypothetical protein
MAYSGPGSKTIKHGRTPTADWTEVADEPFAGPWPIDLPPKCGRARWHEQVMHWWNEVKVMPHCALWRDTDWRTAIELAYIKQQFWMDLGEGDMKSTTATEIRRREDQLGLTTEARRKLRIRYVDPEPGGEDDTDAEDDPDAADTDSAGAPGNVTSITERRSRLLGASG